MVELEQVSKRFGRREAVCPMSLRVPSGSVYGLLGHNGAGKSTLLGMLLGQVFPDRGRLRIRGHDVFARRRLALAEVGAIWETPAFYSELSGWRNLCIFAEYTARVPRRQLLDVVELVGLEQRIGDRVMTYSHGMRQRLALAQALVPRPSLLILDEPTDGLDPEGIHEMRHLVDRLHRTWGLTVLFSSHQLHEVEQLCTHVAVLKEGRLLFDGEWPPPEVNGRWLRFEVGDGHAATEALSGSGLVRTVRADGTARLAEGASVASVNRFLVERGFAVDAIGPLRPTLERFYLQLSAGQGGAPGRDGAEQRPC